MSFKRSTAVTLATITMTLGAGGPALAMPIHDAPTVSQVVPSEVVPSALLSDSDEGMATLVVVLLSTGALAAGAAAGFGGARVSAARTPLHRQ